MLAVKCEKESLLEFTPVPWVFFKIFKEIEVVVPNMVVVINV